MDEEQIAMVGLIGMTFQMIAEKAYAYEKLMGEVPNEDEEESNPFSRNYSLTINQKTERI